MRLIDADALPKYDGYALSADAVARAVENAPTVEKEISKRVLWSGWKGIRDTRYKCPSCKRPVKNDDVYCHRCGQKLMFPHITYTDFVPGEKQQLIVWWDDDERQTGTKGQSNER